MCFCRSMGPYVPHFHHAGVYGGFAPTRTIFHDTVGGRVVPGSSHSFFSGLFGRVHTPPSCVPPRPYFATHHSMHGHHGMQRPHHHPHNSYSSLFGRVRAPGLF